MPRIDGLPAADPLTGEEPFAMMQGSKTKSSTPNQMLDFVVARLSAAGGTIPSTGTNPGTTPATGVPSKVTFDQDGTGARTITFDQA